MTTGARLMAALECANDAGGRCALWPAGTAGAAPAVVGATPQSKGLVRVRGQVCLRTCPRPPGVAPEPSILPGRVLDR